MVFSVKRNGTNFGGNFFTIPLKPPQTSQKVLLNQNSLRWGQSWFSKSSGSGLTNVYWTLLLAGCSLGNKKGKSAINLSNLRTLCRIWPCAIYFCSAGRRPTKLVMFGRLAPELRKKTSETSTEPKLDRPQRKQLGRKKVGYGTVVDGLAKFQALNFGLSLPDISERFSF